MDGSAFHLYAGGIGALSEVHRAHPDKAVYFTEQWMGAHSDPKKSLDEHIRDLVIGATRNWSRNVLEWNLAADSNYQPHTDRGGCDRCQGAVTMDGNAWCATRAITCWHMRPNSSGRVPCGSAPTSCPPFPTSPSNRLTAERF